MLNHVNGSGRSGKSVPIGATRPLSVCGQRTKRVSLLASMVLALWAPTVADAAVRLPLFGDPIEGNPFSYRELATFEFAHPVDLDGDGRQEIILCFGNFPPGPNRAERVIVLSADADSHAYSATSKKFFRGEVPSFVHPRVISTGDFNNDGRIDVFLGGHGYDEEPYIGEPDSLLLSRKAKLTTKVAPPGVPTFTHATASGDINGDGIDDIYVGPIFGGGRGPYFLLGQAKKRAVPIIADDRLPAEVADRDVNFTAAALVGMFGTKSMDLVLGADAGHDSIVYRNDGSGWFNTPTDPMPLPPGLFGRTNTIVVDILPLDANTDGRSDLLLSETANTNFYEGYGLQFLMFEGTEFIDRTRKRLLRGSGFDPAGAWKSRILAADFFGDGLTDFVTHKSYPGFATSKVVWINNGAGVYTPQARKLFDPNDPHEDDTLLLPVDVNLDGRSDLVRIKYVGPGQSAASTYLNLGPGRHLSAPRIVRQPRAMDVQAGSPLLLSTSVRGSRPLNFQWFKDRQALPGATSPIYRVERAELADAGRYRVRIQTDGGSVSSKRVRVKVLLD